MLGAQMILMAASTSSFQIEGRMKGKEWVSTLTESVLKKNPKWHMEEGPISLSIEGAMKHALLYLHEFESLSQPRWRVTKTTLQDVGALTGKIGEDWVYVIEAAPTFNQGPPVRMSLIVLLNGDVVTPISKESKP
jgi:hypothetical protein